MANDMLEKLEAFLESEEGKKSIEEWVLKMRREDEHEERWIDRMWNRIKDDIDGAIEHMCNWYESDKYRDREYGMGFEPREDLLWVLFRCAAKYGKECTDESYANSFTGDMYCLGSYVIQVMHGQGSVIVIDKIKEDGKN